MVVLKRLFGVVVTAGILAVSAPVVGVSATGVSAVSAGLPGLPTDMEEPYELELGKEAVFNPARSDGAGYLFFGVHIEETGSIEVSVGDALSAVRKYEFDGLFARADGYMNKKLDTRFVTAGDYVIRLSKGTAYGGEKDLSGEEFKICVDFHSLYQGKRDGKTADTAFQVKVGDMFLWYADESAQYIRLDVENDSKVKLRAKMEDSSYGRGYNILNSDLGVLTKELKGQKLEIAEKNFSDWVVLDLKAGTYYIQLNKGGFNNFNYYTLFDIMLVEEVDNTPPAKPTKLGYKAGQSKVTGKGEAGCTVCILVGDKYYSGKVNSKGTFTVDIGSNLKKGAVIKVWLMDKALNQGKYVKVTVK